MRSFARQSGFGFSKALITKLRCSSSCFEFKVLQFSHEGVFGCRRRFAMDLFPINFSSKVLGSLASDVEKKILDEVYFREKSSS